MVTEQCFITLSLSGLSNYPLLNFCRYQKRIGTYDKQEWEKTVEQRILDGFNSVNLKNTKLKTELIDVDLVRGVFNLTDPK